MVREKMIGETVFHYRILDKIGEGGMGVVYRAEDINLRRTVALKFLSSRTVGGGSTRERIMKEARAAASLDHQNICAIHEVEEFDEQLFIVMAYCKGRTLGTLIRDEKPGLRESLDILIQIADGLGAAHEAGIIHRDIKPANVIVSDKGKVKIMDFGLAKQSGAETQSMTMAGAGTLAYMSPEQVRGEHVDPRSDIWSLGVLMYQMVTGHRPFEGDYDASVLYNIVNERHSPAIEAEPGTPPEINTVIENCLHKSPDHRYGSIEELRNDLAGIRKYLFGEPETGSAGKGIFPGARHIFGWKMTSFLALAVSVALIYFSLRFFINGGSPGSSDPAGIELTTVSAEAASEADILYKFGRDHYDTGNQPKGIPLIEEALRKDPDHFEALKTLAIYYDWAGSPEKARELVARAKVVAISRDSIDAYILCDAIEATVEHNWEKAVDRYRDLYKRRPDWASTPVTIGYILSKYIGDYEGALEHYQRYFDADPDNESGRHGTVHNYTGTALLYSGEFEKAMVSFRKYQDLVPDSPDPVTSIAGANLFSGNYTEAFQGYASLLSLDDPPFTAYEGLANVCIKMGRLREAEDHVNRYMGSTSVLSQKGTGHLYLARIHLIQKNEAAFDSAMVKAEEFRPGSLRGCWLRGIRFITLGNDVDRARGELIRMTNLMEKPNAFADPSRREHLRGLILLSEGRTTSAINAFKTASENSPREFFFFGREYARILLERGMADEAITECQKLSVYNPNDPKMLMILCRAYSLNDDMTSAKEYYDKTIEVLAEADEDFVPLMEFKEEFEALKSI